MICDDFPTTRPVARQVAISRPLEWLRLGFRDFHKAPTDCLLYGCAFVLMGCLLDAYLELAPELELSFATLFLLAGPFLAIGLYDVSRQMEAFDGRGRVKLGHALIAWRRNLSSFSLFSVILAFLTAAWFLCSLLLFALFYDGSAAPTPSELLAGGLRGEHLDFLLCYLAALLLFALLVFAISVVSIPLLLDEPDVDAMTAILASVQVVRRNLLTMAAWAAIIAAMTAIGFATYFLGLIIIMPVLALSSWHAYRDLITFER
ncbi:hypothetical protein CEK28_16195 [Xenophilus sp. AP218F]|nr:DUF2189 domain-containing protein [Chromobacterium sp. ASV5]OWY37569.1 hypothetical protein CEK28_16195 [Xenophilus sp. AP218F]